MDLIKHIFLVIWLLFILGNISGASTPFHIEKQIIDVTILPEKQSATFENLLSFRAEKPQKKLYFLVNKDIKISGVEHEGKKLEFQLHPDYKLGRFTGKADTLYQDEYLMAAELEIALPKPLKNGKIFLRYTLNASDSVDQAAFSREYIAYQVKGYIGEKGVFISPAYFWYPTLPEDLSHFHISVTTPDSLLIVTEGEMVQNKVDGGKRTIEWNVTYPAGGLHLVGSKFITGEAKYRDIQIYTFFFPSSEALQESYLKACQQYLDMYETMIGPYPFTKFAVVENFFPTGYGMPSYTLLGSQVIRLPFIISTSLGHEIAHNWWGNSVYVDYDSGNWCEGITTYYADHYYKERKDPREAAQYRQDINRDFTVYVKDSRDFPLSKFQERTESSSRAIGYGKSAMVFHQLRKIIGDSLFFRGFQQFYRDYKFKNAGWGDIERTISATTHTDLRWFFQQWLTRSGAPELVIKSVEYQDEILRIALQQLADEVYRLYVPIRIVIDDSTSILRNVWLDQSEQTFTIQVGQKPQQVSVDPESDVFRRLKPNEIPPTLAEIYAKEQNLIVLPDRCPPQKLIAYHNFARVLTEREENSHIITASELSDDDLAIQSLYLLGTPAENSIIRKVGFDLPAGIRISDEQLWIMGEPAPQADDLSVFIARSKNPDQKICIISLGDNQKTGRVANLLSHYGKYSYLIFTDGKNSAKDIFTVTDNPMVFMLR